MVPVGMSMLYRAYPPAKRIAVARLITRGTVVAPASAPIIGGALVTGESWRWIFMINLPIGIAAVLFGALVLARNSLVFAWGWQMVKAGRSEGDARERIGDAASPALRAEERVS